MWKPESAWTRWILTTPVLLVSGCVTATSLNAVCDGTEALRTRHTEALIADGGDMSVVTGAMLIAKIDVGCKT
jgi:hypothetical protein